ncbi:MAG: hypothetical protein MSS13_03905 [Sutterella parvirubra]|uniref:DUF805 domain-containing protein n=1 Tax=Sutterella parvirubra YIT 11816 TaxID=762967 RepID=H3KEZ4_9BURK|nr:hypothetical protein [Sutterella parvirubra]EHY31313.1 hypothetical protein HMPREF9440_01309 [Sutterella parvirubra YIT 11816]MCI7708852.1 hypothetical protein [Sutterella parvirubra]MDY5201492.1 hypothetical protein [Sutterella parvirubra]
MTRSDSILAPDAWSLSPFGRTRTEGFARSLYASALALGVALALAISADRHAVDAVRWAGFAMALGLALLSLWHAVAATARRLRDAGMNPATAAVAAVPGLNLVLFFAIAWRPSVGTPDPAPEPLPGPGGTPVRIGTVVPEPQGTPGARGKPLSADPAERLWTEFLLACEGEPPSLQMQLRVRYRTKLEKLAKDGKCDPETAARMGRRIMSEPLGSRG